MYKIKNLESIFIVIINTSTSNVVVGSANHHPSMDVNEFNKHLLSSSSSRKE